MTARRWFRDVLKSPRNARIDEAVAFMREIEQESRRAVVCCGDCGSRNVLIRYPDGRRGYFPQPAS